jgi:hypothetical protein
MTPAKWHGGASIFKGSHRSYRNWELEKCLDDQGKVARQLGSQSEGTGLTTTHAGRNQPAHIEWKIPMKLTINDDPALGPKVEIEGDGPDMFVIVNGVTIARRGHPDATEASTWVSLEPEWTVTSSEDERRLEIRILYHGEPVILH